MSIKILTSENIFMAQRDVTHTVPTNSALLVKQMTHGASYHRDTHFDSISLGLFFGGVL